MARLEPGYLPTREQIADACAGFQRGWTDDERQRRIDGPVSSRRYRPGLDAAIFAASEVHYWPSRRHQRGCVLPPVAALGGGPRAAI
jgi:hypothetical protein